MSDDFNRGTRNFDSVSTEEVDITRFGQSAQYIITTISGTTYAINSNGKPEFSDSSEATVINSAIEALPGSGTPRHSGRVHLTEGAYTVSSTINLYEGTVLTGEGPLDATVLKLAGSANTDLVKYGPFNNKTVGAGIFNIKLDGNKQNNTSGRAFHLDNSGTADVQDLHCKDVFFSRSPDTVCEIDRAWGLRMTDCLVENGAGIGLDITGGEQGHLNSLFLFGNGSQGLRIQSAVAGIDGNVYSQDDRIEIAGDHCNLDITGKNLTPGGGTGAITVSGNRNSLDVNLNGSDRLKVSGAHNNIGALQEAPTDPAFEITGDHNALYLTAFNPDSDRALIGSGAFNTIALTADGNSTSARGVDMGTGMTDNLCLFVIKNFGSDGVLIRDNNNAGIIIAEGNTNDGLQYTGSNNFFLLQGRNNGTFLNGNGNNKTITKTVESALTAKDTGTVDGTYGTSEADVIENNRTRLDEIETALQNQDIIN